MMIEHEDHDRTPDHPATIVLTLIFVAFGFYAMIGNILFAVRHLFG
jgi:hypothetical protein